MSSICSSIYSSFGLFTLQDQTPIIDLKSQQQNSSEKGKS